MKMNHWTIKIGLILAGMFVFYILTGDGSEALLLGAIVGYSEFRK